VVCTQHHPANNDVERSEDDTELHALALGLGRVADVRTEAIRVACTVVFKGRHPCAHRFLIGYHRSRNRFELLGGKAAGPEESIEATASRELQEEASVHVEDTEWHHLFDIGEPTGKIVISVLTAHVDDTITGTTSQERRMLTWVTYDTAVEALVEHNAGYLRRWNYLHGWRTHCGTVHGDFARDFD
jgi:8-oxo-dGTP pyrophosphatase MutT (NUDIX family)